jgi:plasmid stabilization system protein ParE
VRARVERFAEPAVLLLLREQPAHGYDLLEQLAIHYRRTNRPERAEQVKRQLRDDLTRLGRPAAAGAHTKTPTPPRHPIAAIA